MIRSTPIQCLARCKTTAAPHLRRRCYKVARLLTQATRALLRRLGTTSAAQAFAACATVVSTSVHLKCNANTDTYSKGDANPDTSTGYLIPDATGTHGYLRLP